MKSLDSSRVPNQRVVAFPEAMLQSMQLHLDFDALVDSLNHDPHAAGRFFKG
jgi:hypothetical protein